jgi:ABC-2 type transport system ATP-binding protein
VTDDYIRATGLGLATGHGPVFSDLSFSFSQGRLGVVAGESGTGRSALLLALGGRMRGLTGSLRVAGFDGSNQSKEIRATVSLARISGLVDLEGQLSVGDSITERALTDALSVPRSSAVFGHAETILDRTFDRGLLVDDLSALDRTLLAVALACMRPAHVLLLDDADRQLGLADQRLVMAALQRVTETGITVVTSTLATDAVPAEASVYPMPTRR